MTKQIKGVLHVLRVGVFPALAARSSVRPKASKIGYAAIFIPCHDSRIEPEIAHPVSAIFSSFQVTGSCSSSVTTVSR